jgi:predicted phosphodiesterase
MKIALLSDIHANVFAFQAVLEDLAKYEVSKILICGDLVGYYYWPSEVLDLCMDDSRILAIKGNHESQFLAAFQSPRTMRKMVSRYGTSYQLTKNVLKSNQVEWLNSLPERLDLSFGTTSMTLVHGSLTSQSKYVYPTETLEGLTNCLSKATYTVYGHTHYP